MDNEGVDGLKLDVQGEGAEKKDEVEKDEAPKKEIILVHEDLIEKEKFYEKYELNERFN